MSQALRRPEPASSTGPGLVRHDHFQIAWNTTDMDRAKAIFAERHGVKEWRTLAGPTAQGGKVHMEIGWAGGVMYELLWGEGPGTDVFRAGLPEQGFALRPHHLGYHVPTAEAWDAVRREVERQGLKVLHSTHVPGFLQAIIVEEPDLGLFLEYIFPEEAGIQFFETSPSN
jgi:Glyoxalase/Bleomycin resistance protein/Dioxygenase superfamily